MSNQLTLPTEKVVWTIEDLVNLHQKGKLVVNAEYQRSEVWKNPKKRLLINSILNDYDIGSVILRQKQDQWEILDGQQRLKAITDFVEGALALSKETPGLEGKHWKDLDEKTKWGQFMIRKVYTTKIYSVDDEITSRIFLRVQEGMPLNSAEKLNAMRGKIRNKIFETSQHSFFRETGVSEYRFAYRYLVAQMALQELDNGVSNHTFRQAKHQNLHQMYQAHEKDLPTSVFERIESALDFLQRSLGSSAQVVTKKSDLLTVYLLASYVIQRFASREIGNTFKDFVVRFIEKIERSTSQDSEGYYDYWVARSSSPDSKGQIEKRFQIILGHLLEYAPTLEPKDPQREFDWGQKLAIYARAYREARQRGKSEAECKNCGKVTPLRDGEAHHKTPHSRGGKTIVENGEWLCMPCNRAKKDALPDTGL